METNLPTPICQGLCSMLIYQRVIYKYDMNTVQYIHIINVLNGFVWRTMEWNKFHHHPAHVVGSAVNVA
jgi:hypothetical protein